MLQLDRGWRVAPVALAVGLTPPAIRHLVAARPTLRTIHLVLDNLNTPREASLIKQSGWRHG